MTCKDLNIDKCVGCRISSKCWITVFKDIFERSIKNDVDARLYIIEWLIQKNAPKKSICYLKITLDNYYPQYVGIYNKLAVLL